MPIVITPTGQFVDSVTGNPVDLPPQRPDLPRDDSGMIGQAAMPDMSPKAMFDRQMRERTGSALTAEELQSDIGRRTGAAMTDIEKVQMLMDMGLDQRTAIEAVAMEKDMPPIDPRQFSGQQQAPQQMGQMGGQMPQQAMPPQMADPGMGSLSGVPSGNERPMVMPTPRPEDLMMRQMPSGRDRTFNPRDAINPYNAPNT
tara:strand:- start:287 stop:886 length:600 start_codon:yes stop_codon:yes gene_type:complete